MRSEARYLCAALAIAAAAVVGAAPAAGQTGTVRGVVFDSTEMKPLPGARVVVLGTTATGWSDDSGAFRLQGVPSGSHAVTFFHQRLQALGLGAPSQKIDVPARGEASVDLTVPSESTLLAAWCAPESEGSRFAPLAGFVRDSVTQVALPRAMVTLRVTDQATGETIGTYSTRADDGGYYRFCNVPEGRTVVAQSHFGRSSGERVGFRMSVDRPRFQDLQLVMSEAGRLAGVVRDFTSGQPVEGATVRVIGTDLRMITDAEGEFRLPEVPPGRHLVVTEHLAYQDRTDSVTVFSDELVGVEVRLDPEVVVLEGLTVTARARGAEVIPDLGRRVDMMTRVDIEEILARGPSHVGDLLRNARIPGITVRETRLADPTSGIVVPGICIEGGRQRQIDGCRMVEVYVDGVRIPHPEEFLLSLDVEFIESIQFLSGVEAATRFGGNMSGNGALLITTARGGRF